MIRVVNADELKTAFPCGETVRTESVRATIDHMATVDAEPVRHGHWMERIKVYPDLLVTYNYQCSNCGYWDMHGSNVEVPYCWHCGAKMDEVTNETY